MRIGTKPEALRRKERQRPHEGPLSKIGPSTDRRETFAVDTRADRKVWSLDYICGLGVSHPQKAQEHTRTAFMCWVCPWPSPWPPPPAVAELWINGPRQAVAEAARQVGLSEQRPGRKTATVTHRFGRHGMLWHGLLKR